MRRQHLGAADNQAVAGLLHDAEMRVFVGLFGGRFTAVDLRIDDRMRQKQIVAAAISVVALHVFGKSWPAFGKKSPASAKAASSVLR